MKRIELSGQSYPVIERSSETDKLWNFTGEREAQETGLITRDLQSHPIGSSAVAPEFPQELYIPRSQWPELIKERQANKTTALDLAIEGNLPRLAQGRTKYCWGNGTINAVHHQHLYETGETISLSPASICAPITGFRNKGGFAVQAIEYAAEKGIAPVTDWPPNAIDRRYIEPSKDSRLANRPQSWFDLPYKVFEALASALLRRRYVSVEFDWWGHLVLAMDLVEISPNIFGVLIDNSHSQDWANDGRAVLTQKMATAQGGAVLNSLRDGRVAA